tara:strand:+ start:4687 stop:5880 length:1194 start_codon:yes stop_codon:yes gene_type:complete
MKNILLVMSKFHPEYSGPANRIPRLYKAIQSDVSAANINVVCNSVEYSKDAQYDYDGFNVSRVVCSAPRVKSFPFNVLSKKLYNFAVYNLDFVKSLIHLYRHQKRTDFIHIAGNSGVTAAAIFWANRHKIPMIMELVTAEAKPYQKLLSVFKLKPAKDRAVFVVFNNQAAQRCKNEGYTDHHIWLRPNPIDEALFNVDLSDRDALRKQHTPFSHDDIVILTIAKITPQKNQILLIDVLALLPENYKLVIVGPFVTGGGLLHQDQKYLDDMRQKIEHLGLQGRVFIKAEHVNAAEYIRASNIYAMPASNEGFGTPMIEAIACGVPVVANESEPSFKEWVNNGENGYTAPIDNPKAWADAMKAAAEISEAQMDKQSQRIISLAGQKNIYKKYIEIINKL